MKTIPSSIAALSTLAIALLIPATASAVSVDPTLSPAAMAAELAPAFYFHPDERYLPVTIEEILERSSLRSASREVLDGDMASTAELALATKGALDEYLDIDPAWAESQQDLAGVKVYYNYVRHDGSIDFMYAFLTAYNGFAGVRLTRGERLRALRLTSVSMCNLGRHYGDWEHVTVRVDEATGEVLAVLPRAHGATTQRRPDDVAWTGTHPRIYVALNTHGTYVSEGVHVGQDRWRDGDTDGGAQLEALLSMSWLADTIDDVEIADLTTAADLLGTSGGSFQILDAGSYALARIAIGYVTGFKGRWGRPGADAGLLGSGPRGIYMEDFWMHGEAEATSRRSLIEAGGLRAASDRPPLVTPP